MLIMVDKRLPEMDVDELRALITETKTHLKTLLKTLKECQDRERHTCTQHNFVERVSGPRDNGEHEYVCSVCGLVY